MNKYTQQDYSGPPPKGYVFTGLYRAPKKGEYYLNYSGRVGSVVGKEGAFLNTGYGSKRHILKKEEDVPYRQSWAAEHPAPKGYEYTGEYRKPEQGEMFLTDGGHALRARGGSILGHGGQRHILRKESEIATSKYIDFHARIPMIEREEVFVLVGGGVVSGAYCETPNGYDLSLEWDTHSFTDGILLGELRGWRASYLDAPILTIIDHNHDVLWTENVNATQGDTMTDHPLEAPLNVNREKLITALQARIDEEEAKRAEAERVATEKRQELLDAIAAFTLDELANLLNAFYVSNGNYPTLAEAFIDDKKNDRWVSKENQPNPTENKLAKLVRLLAMTEGETVEVKPSDEIYPLL